MLQVRGEGPAGTPARIPSWVGHWPLRSRSCLPLLLTKESGISHFLLPLQAPRFLKEGVGLLGVSCSLKKPTSVSSFLLLPCTRAHSPLVLLTRPFPHTSVSRVCDTDCVYPIPV